ncbi:MAG: hypothetical protein E7586_02400 [Ruminococcaceae bacterium]|nr:hypothetical protein [Oscillospiraceae bacterium]
MFGYIRPVKGELYVKDSEFYSAIYCGLCRHGGKNISHLTRWLLNYDFVLLALLRMSLSEESVCVEKKRCPYKIKKCKCARADESYSFVCSAFGLLTYHKILDDIRDEKGFKRALKKTVLPVFSRIARKCDSFVGLKEIIERGMSKTSEAEKENCPSPDRAADGFAVMMREIAAYGVSEEKKAVAENCGYHIGRFIYLADAFDDLEQDEKSGNYNPFILHYGSAKDALLKNEEIKTTLYDSLNVFSNCYALIAKTPLNGIDRLIFNITELGGRDAVRRICERKTKNEQSL